jgi:hypothetical protein
MQKDIKDKCSPIHRIGKKRPKASGSFSAQDFLAQRMLLKRRPGLKARPDSGETGNFFENTS